MSSRDAVLASVRAHLPQVERDEPLVPMFDADPPDDLLAAFAKVLQQMGGEFLQPVGGRALAPVREKLRGAKVVCPNLDRALVDALPTAKRPVVPA